MNMLFFRQHGLGIQQQALMGNPNMGMGMNQHPSVSIQIPDPHKMGKPEQNYNKMPPQPQQQQHMQNSPFPPSDCQYPMMSPASLAQNLTVNKKDKNPLSGGSSYDTDRNDPWLNNGNTNNMTGVTGNGTGKKKGKKGNSQAKVKEPGQKKKKKFQAILPPPPPPPPVIIEKEKPFECVTCGRRFTQRIGMLQHQRRHTLVARLIYSDVVYDKT